jgi:tetratricopeptide (TPR) repeat protein
MRGRNGAKWPLVAALALALVPFAPCPEARAQPAPPPATPSTAQKEAETHYQKALALYQTGAYREALGELEAAHALDPNGKELVFNLGVVNEKLGKIDDALRYFRQYAQWEGLTAQEKQKVDGFIRRLEGAKREIPPSPPPPAPRPEKPREPERGRIDAATIVAASFAVAGLGVGTFFGVKALIDRPRSDYTTGRDGSIDDLQRATDTSHREARIADVGFAVGVVAAAVTAYLYFARPKVTVAPSPSAQVSAAPVAGGGAFVVQGSF